MEAQGAKAAARQALVHATIELIEEVGVERVTVRALAERAGVNIAAINYYFGSKSALMEAAMNQTLASLKEDLWDCADRLPHAPKAVAEELMAYLVFGALRFPNVTRSHIVSMLESKGVAKNAKVQLPVFFAPVVDALSEGIAKKTQLRQSAARHRAIGLLSGALFIGFFGDFYPGDLSTEADRAAYLGHLVNRAFAPESS